MGCCMYNLETNIPEVRGCTAFAVSCHDHVYYGRDNDLPPFLKAGSKSEIYRPLNGKKKHINLLKGIILLLMHLELIAEMILSAA